MCMSKSNLAQRDHFEDMGSICIMSLERFCVPRGSVAQRVGSSARALVARTQMNDTEFDPDISLLTSSQRALSVDSRRMVGWS